MEGELISTQAPGKAAIIMAGSGVVTTFGALEARSNQAAQLCRRLGLRAGAAMAFCLENSAELLQIAWGALRSGLVVVPISSRLTASEIAYILHDSGAAILVTSPEIGADQLDRLTGLAGDATLFCLGDARPGYRSWTTEAAAERATPIADQSYGHEMLYSSGTTGRPKGIRWEAEPDDAIRGAAANTLDKYGVNAATVYLSPAPLYHSAPFLWAIGVLRAGGNVVVMERFDPEQALAAIETYRVDTSQWVPTHFVRMLKMPDEVRRKYDVSSLKLAIHAAAPCPVSVKRDMISWWGPILFEYFGSTEQTAMTFITSQEWLERPGSVGRCQLGTIHICDDEGEPVPTGKIGTLYCENGRRFYYHNDAGKTSQSRNRHGWTTVGDVGYVDEDGYIFLTDRKHFMIISGGVNIYPQEIENLLVTHPDVVDAAVIGVPDLEMGEIVTAVIQPTDMSNATPAFAEALRAWMRQSLSSVKVPKRIEFQADLPRLPTGKMQKLKLRERYTTSA